MATGSNGWTPERRARQALLIHTWRPWDKTTGPKTVEGKAKVARNADKGKAAAREAALKCVRRARYCLRQYDLLMREIEAGKPCRNKEVLAGLLTRRLPGARGSPPSVAADGKCHGLHARAAFPRSSPRRHALRPTVVDSAPLWRASP